jgi:hypothetical protein
MEDDGELDWLTLVMGGLEVNDSLTNIPDKIEYPEIDISYAFRPHKRQPKLIRAVIEQPPPVKPTASEIADTDIQNELSAHLQELERLYAFHAIAKPTKPPKVNGNEINKLACFKAIRACIHEAWCRKTSPHAATDPEIHTTVVWTHEDTLAETRQLIENWNFVFKYVEPCDN